MENTEVVLTKITCKRCNGSWIPRTTKIKQCPKCKSPYWNKERKKFIGKNEN